MISKIINTIIHILIALLGLYGILTYPFQEELVGTLPAKNELVDINRVIEWAEIKNSKYSHYIRLKLSDINVIGCDISASGLSDEEILRKLENPNVVSILVKEKEPSYCYAIAANGETILSYDKFVDDYLWEKSLIPWIGGFLLFISVYEYRKLLRHWRSPKLRIR